MIDQSHSSLARLSNAGHIEIDGHDIRDVSLKSLRQQVAIVPQETVSTS